MVSIQTHWDTEFCMYTTTHTKTQSHTVHTDTHTSTQYAQTCQHRMLNDAEHLQNITPGHLKVNLHKKKRGLN